MNWANVAISQLSRIRDDDPQWDKAMQKVLNWINKKIKRRRK
jgi:hypothetical protein